MELAELTALLTADLDPTLAAAVTRAAELRDVGEQWLPTDSVQTMHEHLIALRMAQDSMEGILANLGLVRGRVADAVEAARDAYDEKVGQAIAASKPEEYSTAKERNAAYDLHALKERIEHRRIQRMLAKVGTAHEFVKLRYWGIDGKRRDLDTRLRALSIESRLEH